MPVPHETLGPGGLMRQENDDMAKSTAKPTQNATAPASETPDLRKAAIRGERRLLAAEWDAEQRLAAARAKLAKAEARLAKRQARLAEAEDLLRQQQAARAAGPLAETA